MEWMLEKSKRGANMPFDPLFLNENIADFLPAMCESKDGNI